MDGRLGCGGRQRSDGGVGAGFGGWAWVWLWLGAYTGFDGSGVVELLEFR